MQAADIGASPIAIVVADTLDALFESFQLLVPYDRVGYAVIDERNHKAVEQWCRSKRVEPVHLKVGYEAPLARSSLADIAATGTPRVINDLQQYHAEHPGSESTRLILADGIRSSLTCPVRVHGNTVGFLFFSSCEPNTYTNLNPQGLVGLAAMFSAVVAENLEHRVGEELTRQLRNQAMRDPLTGLLNRRGLETTLQSKQPGTPGCGLIVIDLDTFKGANDSRGHAYGDQVLRSVAKVLVDTIRRRDYACRVGGDEFVVLLDDSAGLARVANSIVDGVSQLNSGVTASVGYLSYAARDADPTQLLEAADAAMYVAKRSGGNRAVAGTSL